MNILRQEKRPANHLKEAKQRRIEPFQNNDDESVYSEVPV